MPENAEMDDIDENDKVDTINLDVDQVDFVIHVEYIHKENVTDILCLRRNLVKQFDFDLTMRMFVKQRMLILRILGKHLKMN